MHIYCKKCSKHTANTIPKKLILISKNKIKENLGVLYLQLKDLLLMKLNMV